MIRNIPNGLAAFLTLVLLIAAGCAPNEQANTPSAQVRQDVEQAIAGLDAMRSGLAASITSGEEVGAETFARVCKPVGMTAKQLASDNGWEVRQIAVKFRNPDNAADPEAAARFADFESDTALDSLWIRTDHAGAPGWRYLRRITVESACLACHGAEDTRPAFIKEKYPDDRAVGFAEGDLRGLYSVFVPDTAGSNR